MVCTRFHNEMVSYDHFLPINCSGTHFLKIAALFEITKNHEFGKLSETCPYEQFHVSETIFLHVKNILKIGK